MKNTESQKTPSDDDSGHGYRKIVPCNHKKARFVCISNVMPEVTEFKMQNLKCLPKDPEVYRILGICGNLAHFAGGEMFELMMDYWIFKDRWDHVVFLPGPHDYGSGTVELGDAHCRELQKKYGHDRLTILLPGIASSVVFAGPTLHIIGAPCWPVEKALYREAGVYYVPNGDLSTLGMAEAVAQKMYLSNATAQKRLKGDIAIIKRALIDSEQARSMETRILMTYGCPDEQLSVGVKEDDVFRGNVSFGDAKFFRYLDGNVDYWMHGAKGDKLVAKLGKITVYHNSYRPQHDDFLHSDGILVTRKAPPPTLRFQDNPFVMI